MCGGFTLFVSRFRLGNFLGSSLFLPSNLIFRALLFKTNSAKKGVVGQKMVFCCLLDMSDKQQNNTVAYQVFRKSTSFNIDEQHNKNCCSSYKVEKQQFLVCISNIINTAAYHT